MLQDELKPTRSPDGADELCREFHRRWQNDAEPPEITSFLDRVAAEYVEIVFRRLLAIDAAERRQRDLAADAALYHEKYPESTQAISEVLGDDDALSSSGVTDADTPSLGATVLRTMDFAEEAAPIPGVAAEEAMPAWVGRYAVDRVLGSGGFGRVYLARDTELERPVAIKVPHRHRLATPQDVDAFLEEARTVASLDHPGVVPIYDFGRFNDRCYVVSKYIDGEPLSQRLHRSPPSVLEAIRLLRSIAETLQFLHLAGVVHRDVKPGNLLLDQQGHCFLTDFGLALRDFSYGLDAGRMGTVNYMSPEQARGEGHLVDGRTDLFALGVMMYEMLTGTRPFVGSTWQQVVTLVCHHEPRPLRHLNQTIPKELERICLKLLAKRASDRYLTAQDLIDDLSHFLDDSETQDGPPLLASAISSGRPFDSQQQLVGIIPRGLRSFDQEDAAFFRELLPGPRNREGLPDSLRFWKRRIESDDPIDLFRVGVIYGPSGSGKSSFVKAGLLPVLEPRMTFVFIEASSSDTEQRLLFALRLRCPDIPADLGLTESVAWLRRSATPTSRRRVLIVIDQFEQWLNAWNEAPDSELALALRQCDGEQLQCLLLIRDDFWLSISRLADQIEVDLVPTKNLQMVDLFDKRHARKVLAEYGRAYGRLPDNLAVLSKSQEAFLDQAIEGLSEGGKLIPVQLATFSEIMKSREWQVSSFKDLGGVQGVGERFLEESFSSSNAPMQNQTHEAAAQAILKALLPEAGTNIKGAMRSESELRAAAGYEEQPRRFDQVCKILDGDLRLITPTDPHGRDMSTEPDNVTGQRFYQLTHDFLVPAVRSWLNRRQQMTLSGRAAIRLADRAEIWTSRPEQRHLPNWVEWVSFLVLTRPAQRDSHERRMMKTATRKHTATTAIALCAALLLLWIGFEVRGQLRASALSEQLATATTADAAGIIDQLELVRRWSRPPLFALTESHGVETNTGLHARLALLRNDADNDSLLTSLSDRLMTVDLNTLPLIRDELAKSPHRDRFRNQMWSLAEDEDADPNRRLRAGLVLATYQPPTNDKARERWDGISQIIADEAIRQSAGDPRYYLTISQAIMPVRDLLVPHLRRAFSGADATPERRVATRLVIDLFADESHLLADAYLDADEAQGLEFLPLLDDSFAAIRSILESAVVISPTPHTDEQVQDAVSNRQVNAAALLMRHGATAGLWDLLQHDPIPNTRSGLIERGAAWGLDPEIVLDQVPSATKDGVLSALLLMLGTYDSGTLTISQRDRTQTLARDLFVTHPQADVHSAAEWLLRRLEDEGWISRSLEDLAFQETGRERQWYVNSQGQTLVRIDDGNFSFDISTTEVTMKQFRRVRVGRYEKAPYDRCPAILVSWFDAVEYCRWLTAEEGLGEDQMCYPPVFEGEENVQLHEDYRNRRGYRLPTVEEWEAACFGGSKTRFFFGHRASLLDAYAQVRLENPPSVPLCGLKKPSPNGLFDMIGNESEWCSSIHRDTSLERRPICGANYEASIDKILKLSHGGVEAPHAKYYTMGFRIVRSSGRSE